VFLLRLAILKRCATRRPRRVVEQYLTASSQCSGVFRSDPVGAVCVLETAHPGRAALHVERTNAWHNAFNRLQRCYERNEDVIDAFFDLADAIITVRRLIRQAWTLYRWDGLYWSKTLLLPLAWAFMPTADIR